MRDGIPIGAGYFAVAFSLGITAKGIGLRPITCMITSVLCHASAGEYAVYTVIGDNAAYITMAVMVLIANARYLLMSCAMSQRMAPSLSFFHRLFMGFGITDELFAISIARPGMLNPNYMYGGMFVSIPLWALGSGLGCFSGEVLPERIVSALSVALFGMFLAIIIPPARDDKIIRMLIIISFAVSFVMSKLPGVSSVPSGTRIIILTVVISAIAAILFPADSSANDSAHATDGSANATDSNSNTAANSSAGAADSIDNNKGD
ncbi:MAG: AzlC family ABC transporter permease [Lachnospiraceae bacterium]|nr:AzlC family ABC transporter permease [Lachnospiraceae bacterium]